MRFDCKNKSQLIHQKISWKNNWKTQIWVLNLWYTENTTCEKKIIMKIWFKLVFYFFSWKWFVDLFWFNQLNIFCISIFVLEKSKSPFNFKGKNLSLQLQFFFSFFNIEHQFRFSFNWWVVVVIVVIIIIYILWHLFFVWYDKLI